MKTITCEEYDQCVSDGMSFVMLDVRTTEEFAAGHMPDAINVPLHILPLSYMDVLPDKSQRIISCCASGGRASQAAAFLIKEGYTDVVVLEGGYGGYCARNA